MELKEFLEHALKNVNDGVSWHHNLVRTKGLEQVFITDLESIAKSYDQLPSGPLNATALHEILNKSWDTNSKINEIQGMVIQLLAATPMPPTRKAWRGWDYPYPRTLSESFVINEKPELHKALINPSGFYQRVNQRVQHEAQLSWSDVFGFFQPQIADHTVSEWLFDLSKK